MQSEAAIAHLVAPQLWAWAPWRIRKLRRLTDRVLCVLPFEPAWFAARDVPAVFVGHPLFDPPPTLRSDEDLPGDLPREGRPRVALLPGSRSGEIRANWPTMLTVARDLRRQHPHLHAIVAASSQANADLIESLSPRLTRAVPVLVGRVDDVLDWSDVALVTSGTATLHVAARRKPMVVLYNVNRWAWHGARWLIQTRTFTLPNLIGESMGAGRIVPEFVPHFGQTHPIERELERLLSDPAVRQKQIEAFAKLAEQFADSRFSTAAADEIEKLLRK
jgi:lipid-A-disaccharide synthase